MLLLMSKATESMTELDCGEREKMEGGIEDEKKCECVNDVIKYIDTSLLIIRSSV